MAEAHDDGGHALRLDGRVALVTGGTRGIGRACGQLLARRGCRVVVVGRDREDGLAAARDVGGAFLAADMLDPESPERLVAEIAASHGRLDILLNNAGTMGEAQNVSQTTHAALERTLALHVGAPWMMMVAALPLLARSGRGSIVNIASVAGQRVGASSAAYSAAKAAMIHMTRLAAAEFGAQDIRVNSISPGFIPTGIHAQALADGDPRQQRLVDGLGRLFRQRQALDRLGSAEDIAEIAAFLASDAARFISGSDVVADGGMMWGRAGLM